MGKVWQAVPTTQNDWLCVGSILQTEVRNVGYICYRSKDNLGDDQTENTIEEEVEKLWQQKFK